MTNLTLPGLENAEDKTRASKRHELALRLKTKEKKEEIYRRERREDKEKN